MTPSDQRGSGIKQWLETRWPIEAVVRWSTEEDIAGGPRFFYTLGSITLFLFAVQVITGIWQMLYYVPTVDHAYASVMYLRLQVPLGWLVHGLHYWGANAFIVVMSLHVMRVFVWGAYKKPRELVWAIGVVLLLLAATISFTGAILPWDMRGYWAGEVGTNIAGTVPVAGTFLKALMRGGASMAQPSLSRFFVAHIALLPAVLALLICVHLVAFRRFGSVGPWNPDAARKTGPFWPDQVFKDMLMISMVFFLLICLSAFLPAPISGPADPLDNYYAPKPEWNFLFLYEILKVFKGPLERVGTIGVPLLLILLLFSVPFIDRGETRNPLKRPRAMAAGFVVAGGILVSTVIGYYSSPGGSRLTGSTAGSPTTSPVLAPAAPPVSAARSESPPAPASARRPSPAGQSAPARGTEAIHVPASAATVAPAGPAAPAETALAGTALAANLEPGAELFTSANCVKCHTIGGRGGTTGPNLSFEARLGRTREWLLVQILDPARHNPNTRMPAARNLTDRQTGDLIDFLLRSSAAGGLAGGSVAGIPSTPSASKESAEWSARLFPGVQRNPAPGDAKSLAAGRVMYQGECLPCHGASGKGDGPASLALPENVKVSDLSSPVMAGYTDGALFAVISKGRGAMPAFESLMTETQLWQVIDYMRTLAPERPAPREIAEPQAVPGATGLAKASPAQPSPMPTGAPTARPKATFAASPRPPDARKGDVLFTAQGCIACHRMHGRGGAAGPDLSYEVQSGRSRSWLDVQIVRPAEHNPETLMPTYPSLAKEQIEELVTYILAPAPGMAAGRAAAPYAAVSLPLPSPAVDMIGDPGHGRVLYEIDCRSCHGEDGRGQVPNPGSTAAVVPALAPIARTLFSADPSVFAKRIDPLLQRGATPAGPGPRLRMPAFGATRSLTQEQIANVEAYVLKLNAVNRAEILNPGVRPARFVEATAALFALALLLGAALRSRSRKEES